MLDSPVLHLHGKKKNFFRFYSITSIFIHERNNNDDTSLFWRNKPYVYACYLVDVVTVLILEDLKVLKRSLELNNVKKVKVIRLII